MIKEIYLAGGCFWGVQAYIDRVEGVIETNVGYANGNSADPSYYDIKNTGHTETVYVKYDHNSLSLERLLEIFFKVIDPTTVNKQGNDIGTQYRTGIYYTKEEDIEVIEKFINDKQREYNEKIATEVLPLENYYLAEEYHQNYLIKNPSGYCHIDLSSLPERIK